MMKDGEDRLKHIGGAETHRRTSQQTRPTNDEDLATGHRHQRIAPARVVWRLDKTC